MYDFHCTAMKMHFTDWAVYQEYVHMYVRAVCGYCGSRGYTIVNDVLESLLSTFLLCLVPYPSLPSPFRSPSELGAGCCPCQLCAGVCTGAVVVLSGKACC